MMICSIGHILPCLPHLAEDLLMCSDLELALLEAVQSQVLTFATIKKETQMNNETYFF